MDHQKENKKYIFSSNKWHYFSPYIRIDAPFLREKPKNIVNLFIFLQEDSILSSILFLLSLH